MNSLDTSVRIKRFVVEKGLPLVSAMVIGKVPATTATIAYAEAYAGLTRKHRDGHLSEGRHVRACRQFKRDWKAYVRVELV